jgi:hypothetical protein
MQALEHNTYAQKEVELQGAVFTTSALIAETFIGSNF